MSIKNLTNNSITFETMTGDYYQTNIVKNFQDYPSNIDYQSQLHRRNPEVRGKLSLNHIEYIEFHVRLLKPRNFIELGVQLGECTRRLIPLIPENYYGIDLIRHSNINLMCELFPNFKFFEMTTDTFFEKHKNENLEVEMAFIDACHSHLASYNDFLNVKDHMVNDGIIFFHDTYPVSEFWTSQGLCGNAYLTAEKIRKEHSDEFEITTIPINPGLSIARKIPIVKNRHTVQLQWLS